jgi:hypothetical protein
MFSEKETMQFEEKGISRNQLEWQLNILQKGVPFIKLDREAAIADGIICLTKNDIKKYHKYYTEAIALSVIKFVPASGAASRMFKDLFEFIETAKINQKGNMEPLIKTFFTNLNKFAFFNELKKIIEKKGYSINELINSKNYSLILEFLLSKEGLNYGTLPKGLLHFHKYKNESRTSFEEHLCEGALYGYIKGNPVRLHFTVSPEHLQQFKFLLKEKIDSLEKRFETKYEVDFSIQKPSTDTIAVDIDNKLFHLDNGKILFRPGGHGALIDNLNELDADIIFIKNIDNVIPEKNIEPTVIYKKALAGLLVNLQTKVFTILKELDNSAISKRRANELLLFMQKDLCYEPNSIPDFSDSLSTNKFFKDILNRPLRVCGVVKNMGEYGGAPFWAPNSRGDITLQIIEYQQVDNTSDKQIEIFKKATHFNPVDIVCSPRCYNGTKHNLKEFVDNNTCFISQKSKGGKDLKALELPGLWNGAMADWLTLFVEVPYETFNPVKTVNDLLRLQHQ